MQETQVQSLGWEDPLEKEMATYSSILAWRIPWTEEPGRLQSMGLQRVGHDWVTSFSLFTLALVTAGSQFQLRFIIYSRDWGLGLLQAAGVASLLSQHTDTHPPPEAEMPQLTENKEGFEAAFQEAEDQLMVFRFWATWWEPRKWPRLLSLMFPVWKYADVCSSKQGGWLLGCCFPPWGHMHTRPRLHKELID